MSVERPEIDEGDVSISEASSWADAQADTPTMGNGRSDSEDTLSNLSFDNDIGLDSPGGVAGMVESTETEKRGGAEEARHSEMKHQPPSSLIRLKLNDYDVNDDNGLSLPPGVEYRPPSVDFPTSPSQLKISQGASYMPTEDLSGVLSEDESTSVNSYRAHLNLNGDVRITKREEELASLRDNYLDGNGQGELDSLQIENSDEFEDYHEDFFNPLSNELVMQRATSFRRKVQQQIEDAVIEKAMKEIKDLDVMLDSYEEDGGETDRKSDSKCQTTPERKKYGGQHRIQSHVEGLSPSPNFVMSNGKTISTIHGSSVRSSPAKVFLSDGSSSNNSGNSSVTSSKNCVEFDHNVSLEYEQLIKNRGLAKGRNPNGEVVSRLNVNRKLFQEEEEEGEPESMLDIDAICRDHAPNLMNSTEPMSFQIPQQDDETASSYFLSKDTVEKITSVFESSNFNNIYTLSGELKHILSAIEIEEIIANKEHLATVLDPNIMAALSWSLNPMSLPDNDHGKDGENRSVLMGDHAGSNKLEKGMEFDLDKNYRNVLNGNDHDGELEEIMLDDGITKDDGRNCFSSATSISNGFHSKESSMTDVSDQNELDEPLDKRKSSNMVPVKDDYAVEQGPGFQRGSTMTASMRRKISLGKSLRIDDIPEKYVEEDGEVFGTPKGLMGDKPKDSNVWKSLESLDDLGVDGDGDSRHGSEDGDEDAPKMFLVRRDSKRFNKGMNANRVVQGLFIESKNTNGTLKRLKVPLNIEDYADVSGDKSLEDESAMASSENQDDKTGKDTSQVKSPKNHKKRISVDDKILSIASELDDSYATDATQSDVFHSFVNSVKDEDRTIKSDDEDDEDVTLDLDTPDDMEGSILEQLESSMTSPVGFRERIPELSAAEEMDDERRWKSFRVGVSDINIDLQAIQPYRRVLSHGGYADAEQKCAIILFSGCYLPDRDRKEYTYLMDHLFLYVLSTLEELIVDDYILVYLHGATPASCMPKFTWLKRCYQLVDHRLRKNLKGLYLVHPTLWLKAVVTVTKPFVSSKFSNKLKFINTLSDLCLQIPTEHLVIPDQVLQYDFELKLTDLKRQNKLS